MHSVVRMHSEFGKIAILIQEILLPSIVCGKDFPTSERYLCRQQFSQPTSQHTAATPQCRLCACCAATTYIHLTSYSTLPKSKSVRSSATHSMYCILCMVGRIIFGPNFSLVGLKLQMAPGHSRQELPSSPSQLDSILHRSRQKRHFSFSFSAAACNKLPKYYLKQEGMKSFPHSNHP